MSSFDYEMRRLETKVTDLNKKLAENKRLSKRNDSQKLWELDRLKREFETRERRYASKERALNKELEAVLDKRARTQKQVDRELEKQQAEADKRPGRNFKHRIH